MESSTGKLRPSMNPKWHLDTPYGRSFSGPPLISSSLPLDEAIVECMDETLHASRAYVLASRSLATNSDFLKRLETGLGHRHVQTRIGMKPHTFISEVIEVILEARRVEADVIVTLGGGSLSDAAKAAAFCLSNNVTSAEELKQLPNFLQPDAPAVASGIPVIAIPTTLSAGEFTPFAGVTDDADHCKYQLCPPLKAPAIVILDGELALTTPLHTWLSTGVRSVDHCVEALLNITPPGPRANDKDEACIEGLKCLVPGLLHTKANPASADARHQCQLGLPLCTAPYLMGATGGASHGIGHMLGPLGVGHGETSCILMPAVHKWNAAHGADLKKQKLVCSVLWKIDEARAVFTAKGLSESLSDLGDLLDAFLREIGMPRTLSEVGVAEDQFMALAQNSMKDMAVITNPAPIKDAESIVEILNMCK